MRYLGAWFVVYTKGISKNFRHSTALLSTSKIDGDELLIHYHIQICIDSWNFDLSYVAKIIMENVVSGDLDLGRG